jgi:hypothetical protein
MNIPTTKNPSQLNNEQINNEPTKPTEYETPTTIGNAKPREMGSGTANAGNNFLTKDYATEKAPPTGTPRQDGLTKTTDINRTINVVYTKSDEQSSVPTGTVVNPENNQQYGQLALESEVKVSRDQSFKEQYLDAATTSTFREIFNGLVVNAEMKRLVNEFKLIVNPQRYVIYKSKIMDAFSDNSIPSMANTILEVIKDTENMFRYGSALVSHELNPDFFSKYGIDLSRGVPLVPNLIKLIGRGSGSQDTATYPAGILLILLAIVMDNRIDAVGKTRHPISMDAEFSNVVMSKYQENVGPHPVLLGLFSTVTWLRDRMRTMIEDKTLVNYKLGIAGMIFDPMVAVKKVEKYALNIDQYSASILNLNISELIRASDSMERKINGIKAHAFPGTQVFAPQLSELRPEMEPDVHHQNRILALIEARYPMTEYMIMNINKDYFESTGFIRAVDKNHYFPPNFTGANYTNFLDKIRSYIRRANMDDISLAFAREIGPQLSVRYMNPLGEDFASANSIVVIFQLLMFCWLFPSTFDSIKGQVQNVLLMFFSKWYPDEYLRFIAQYGTLYRITQGAIVFQRRDEIWRQSMYLTDVFPSLFSGIDFARCPRISGLMKWFKPQGAKTATPDTAAMLANFPRSSRSPSHYIPFTRQDNRLISNLSTQFNVMTNELIDMAIKRGESDSNRTAHKEVIVSWFRHMQARFSVLSVAFTEHASVIYETMSNFMLNHTQNFNGSFRTFKPDRYGVVSSTRQVVPILTDVGEREDRLNGIDTSIIWPILGQCEMPIVRQAGFGTDLVPVDEKIIFPDPDISYSTSLLYMKSFEQICLPDAYTTYIFSSSARVDTYEFNMQNGVETFRVIRLDAYDNQIRETLIAQGYAPPIFLTGLTTLAQVQAYVGANVPIVQYVSGIIQPAISDYLIANDVFVLHPRLLDDYNAMFLFTGNQIVPGWTKINISVYVLLNIEDRVSSNPNLAKLHDMLPTLSDSSRRFILEHVAGLIKVDVTDYASVALRFLGNMNYSVILHNPEIRRMNENSGWYDFDEAIDIESYRYSNFFMTDLQLRRLDIGFNMIFRPAFSRLYKGLRLYNIQVHGHDPAFIPQPGPLPRINFAPALFQQVRIGVDIDFAFVDPATGLVIESVNDWPKIHLLITNRFVIDDLIKDRIMAGIMEAGWMVDVLDVSYTAEILIPSESITSPTTLQSVMTSPSGSLLHLQFFDSFLQLAHQAGMRAKPGSSKRLIFPLQSIVSSISARGLVDGDDRQPKPGAVSPNNYECDTGDIHQDGTLVYTAGGGTVRKLDIDRVSTTNMVLGFTDNVKLDEPVQYMIRHPESLFPIDPLII